MGRLSSEDNGENTSIHSQNDLRGVAGGDSKLGCLCGKAGTSHVCDSSAHSSGGVVYGFIMMWHPLTAVTYRSPWSA